MLNYYNFGTWESFLVKKCHLIAFFKLFFHFVQMAMSSSCFTNAVFSILDGNLFVALCEHKYSYFLPYLEKIFSLHEKKYALV